MKSLRFTLSVLLLSFTTAAFAQSATAAPQSDAQKFFAKLKTLAGSWEGQATMSPSSHESMSARPMHAVLRVTSMGNAIMHEMKGDGPEDPITMIYLDGDHLYLTHYCDAGNRPRMAGKISPDGNTVEFDVVDVSGSTKQGHMQRAVFRIIDANHHTEDWTYSMPNGKPEEHGHLDLQRSK